MTAALPDEPAAVSADTREAARLAIEDAKARGWSQAGLRAYFDSYKVTLADYKAAFAGEPVSGTTHGLMVQLSIIGLAAPPGTSSIPPVDHAQIAAFTDALMRYASEGVNISIRAFLDGGREKPLRITYAKLNGAGLAAINAAAVEVATLAATHAEPAVFCPPIAGFGNEAEPWRASEKDLVEAYALSVECDANASAARETLEAIIGPATVVVASGGEWVDPETGEVEAKLHLHWRLSEPAAGDDRAKLKEARRSATAIVGGDPTNIPMVHPIRWPGSLHRKREPRLAQIVSLTEAAEIDLGHAAELLADRAAMIRPPAPIAIAGAERSAAADAEYEALVASVLRGENLHDSIARLAAKMVGSGTYPGAAVNILRGIMNGSAAPRDLRWMARFEDIPRAVQTAEAKFSPELQPRQQGACHTPTPTLNPWERFIAPSFPLEALPPVLQSFTGYIAASIGCDPSAVAMAALTVCSGALDQQFKLKMKRTGNWQVRPRLWTVLIGAPSAKKSPLMSACMRPLQDHEAEGIRVYQREMAAWNAAKTEKGDAPQPSRAKRFVLDDTTTEAVGDILSRQDRGALSFRDELSGWIGSMEKYSGGKGSAADRSFWLQAYNGGSKTFDRISRGEIFINNLCVAFLGGIQPERLGELGKLTSDGLLQRFLPVMMKPPSYAQEVPDDAPAVAYTGLIDSLLRLLPHGLVMDEGASAAAANFQRYLFDLEQMEGLGSNFSSFVGKLAGIHGSLSLVLHMADDPQEASYGPVSERVVRAAECIVREFIIPHALELYRSTGDGADWDDLRSIASFILTSPKDRLTPSDLTSGVRALRGMGLWELAKKLSPLVAGGWLAEDVMGGAVKAWTVAPGLREALSERRAAEAQRKSDVLRTLKSLQGEQAA